MLDCMKFFQYFKENLILKKIFEQIKLLFKKKIYLFKAKIKTTSTLWSTEKHTNEPLNIESVYAIFLFT